MKYAVLADIHGNLAALQAVLRDANEQRCSQYVFLGDYVGYCADSKGCIDIIRRLNAPCVKGNWDKYCVADAVPMELTPAAASFAERTRKQINEDDRQWLRHLPYTRTVEDFTIVHATLDVPERWGYVFENIAAAGSIACQSTSLCFFGHTHVPVTFVHDGVSVSGSTYQKFKIDPKKRYFVNPGSVGQPRDGNPDAAYVVYDGVNRTIELRRVPYDHSIAQR